MARVRIFLELGAHQGAPSSHARVRQLRVSHHFPYLVLYEETEACMQACEHACR
jgi:hypothetical protein